MHGDVGSGRGAGGGGQRPPRWAGPAAAVLLAVAVGAVLTPALGLELTGDSYQWVQHAHRAMHRPTLLLADLDSFYRPASTWTLVADRLLWDRTAAGYHLTNLALHWLAATLLLATGRRLGLRWGPSSAVALLWVLSPFTDEPAVVAAYRFQLLLAVALFGLVAAWPTGDERLRGWRLTGVLGLTVLAAASKESWVVLPVLVVVLEVVQRRRSLRAAVVTALPFAAAVAVYVATYALAFAGAKPGYYHVGWTALAKIPHELAAFLWLEPLRPLGFEASSTGAAAVVVLAAVGWLLWRRRVRAGLAAAALLIVPSLPTLLVPYLPQRYTAIPYAGFLLLGAVALEVLAPREGARRRVVMAGAAMVAALVGVAGVLAVRADLADYRGVSAAHARLLAEARAVAGVVAGGGPVVVVRAERDQPLLDVLRDPRGLPKLPYTRHQDPYGLVDAAALFDWVVGGEGVVERVDDWSRVAGRPGRVLIHRSGGFEVEPEQVPDVAAAAEAWRRAGAGVRIVEVVR